jgi:Domain of unknown function (DUF6430)
MLAIAHLNEHGNAFGTFDGLKEALAELWVFIGNRGSKERIVVPVLGSKYTRLVESRQVIVQEIIKSFVAACTERTFCEDLVIVLSATDVFEKKIDFDALCDYLKHVSLYTEVSARSAERVGTAEA